MTNKGVLYIVATPIGNLDDISVRAIATLKKVNLIAAEDTRHSQRLLQHFGIDTKAVAYHDHSSDTQSQRLLDQLESGVHIALISDAGTPLISDPGYRIVKLARERGIQVSPIPGASAPISALSAAGLPTDRFSFEGFLPAKTLARCKVFESIEAEPRTMVFFESPHRIKDALIDAVAVLGASREAVMARELTKTFETFLGSTLGEIAERVAMDSNQSKGEIVLIISGKEPVRANVTEISADTEQVLKVLSAELPTKQAASLASQITGVNKKLLYQRVVELKN